MKDRYGSLKQNVYISIRVAWSGNCAYYSS